MPISMRALKTFSGRSGESRRPEHLVEAGDDLNVVDQRRADYLEHKGFAVPLIQPRAKAEAAPANKMEPAPQNKAASAGPLPSAGGKTGETTGEMSEPASSSPQGRAPNRRGSRRPADKLDL